ncbi:hypothetical protein ABTX81_19715 [Kitasatospora sp. NPDC097605]|uniref:hypothetical protein n=1 Tax=Kitasatospora sp. NPDC097605 TaxID=3157226 RepID=UPI00331ADCE3
MSSFQRYGPPSLVLSDGLVTVPLWAVTSLDLNRQYQYERIGPAEVRETVRVSGLLVGAERFAWRAALEALAEHETGTGAFAAGAVAGSAGTGLAGAVAGAATGAARPLTLLAESTIRTDLRIVALSFAERAERREVVEVSLTLAHAPEWQGGADVLADAAVAGLSALADWESHRGQDGRR